MSTIAYARFIKFNNTNIICTFGVKTTPRFRYRRIAIVFRRIEV